MAFQPVEFAAGAVVHNKLPGNQDFLVDLNFLFNAVEPTQVQLVDLANLVDEWWGLSVLPNLCDAVTYNETIVTQLALEFGFQVSASANGGVGSVATEMMPNAMCACLSLRTGIRGRSFRGRNYVSGIPTAQVTENVMLGTFLDAIEAAYEELLPGGAHDPSPAQWVVVSRVFNKLPRTVGIATPIVNVLFTDNVIDDQRRRKPGVGN